MPILLANFAAHTASNIINSRSSDDPTDQRSFWDIFWSCVVTIFACTWIAIHPNIPAADDIIVVIILRRIGLMLCGMIAPEIIILWAMRQWYSARRIGKAHKDKGWTTTHGFFIQMGGFMMHNGRYPYPIQLNELEARHMAGEIIWPKITETEIQDRSKGDALSKGIVILQTLWFVVQCIGRRYVGLAITELELITLAFAALNIATYFFWWNKPVDVRCPHPIYLEKNTGTEISATVAGDKSLPTLFGRLIMDFVHFLWACIKLFVPPIMPILRSKGARLLMILGYIQRPPSLFLKFLLRGALAIKGNPSRITAGRVPTLYAARLDSNPTVFFSMTIVCAFIGSVFGGIHCIAWSFQFLSHQDQSMWRVSSLVITCAPLPIALLSNDMSHMEDDMLVHWVGLPRIAPEEWTIDSTQLSNQDRRGIELQVDVVARTSEEDSTHSRIQRPNEPIVEVDPQNMAHGNASAGQLSYIRTPQMATVAPDPRPTPQDSVHRGHQSWQINNFADSARYEYHTPISSLIQPSNTTRYNARAQRLKSYKSLGWYRDLPRRYTELISHIKGQIRAILSLCLELYYKLSRSQWYIALSCWLSSVGAIMQGTARFQYTDHLTSWRYALMTFIWVTKCLLLAGLTSAYIAARFILILQALKALKTLPPDALQTMKWTNYIPHI